MIRIVFTIVAAALMLLSGCATTTIDTPIGRYTSSRDSQLDELRIEIIETPDGGKTTIVEVGGASGQASTVIDSQTELIRAIVEAFAAGLKAGG